MWLDTKEACETVRRKDAVGAERGEEQTPHWALWAWEIPILFGFENQRGIIL